MALGKRVSDTGISDNVLKYLVRGYSLTETVCLIIFSILSLDMCVTDQIVFGILLRQTSLSFFIVALIFFSRRLITQNCSYKLKIYQGVL